MTKSDIVGINFLSFPAILTSLFLNCVQIQNPTSPTPLLFVNSQLDLALSFQPIKRHIPHSLHHFISRHYWSQPRSFISWTFSKHLFPCNFSMTMIPWFQSTNMKLKEIHVCLKNANRESYFYPWPILRARAGNPLRGTYIYYLYNIWSFISTLLKYVLQNTKV